MAQEIQQKIQELERQFNAVLFEDDELAEKLYNKIQALKRKLSLSKE
jgi:hypothetical protein